MQGDWRGGAAKSGVRGRRTAKEATEAKPLRGSRSMQPVRCGAREASADMLTKEEDALFEAPAVEEVTNC